MGTDIYVFLEAQRDDGTWESRDTWENGRVVNPVYDDRSYALYAILAGIRNGMWGNHYIPIAIGRDLPEDVSPQVAAAARRYAGRWGQDDNDDVTPLTWLTLDEFYSYPHWHDEMLHYPPSSPSSTPPYPGPVWRAIKSDFWFTTLMEIGKRTCDVPPHRVRLVLAFSD